ncbi:MAG: 3-deoxy-manno-octulosonate cytidylyltransferase [Pseudomonadota bacterium]
MKSLIIIPARMASTRLPGKPLADIQGVPMIMRVCERAAAADIGPVWVAAAEAEIVASVEHAGFSAVLTEPNLPSGSDRVHAALQTIDPDQGFDVIVNLQGDMPTLDPSALKAVLKPLEAEPDCDVATLAAEIRDDQEVSDPNVVKAVLGDPSDGHARAHYFSRAAVPTGEGPLWHHVGVYAWRRGALDRFVQAQPSALEKRERLEQLRALELGMRIDCAMLSGPPPNGVDTPEDLEAARTLYRTAR